MLEDDFEVHESVSREEALELVRDIGDFDVTIVDMRWRQNGAGASISGPEAIRMLRRSSPGLGIVAHGERPERHIASAAMQAGASAYVVPHRRRPRSCAARSTPRPPRRASSTRRCRRKAAAAS